MLISGLDGDPASIRDRIVSARGRVTPPPPGLAHATDGFIFPVND